MSTSEDTPINPTSTSVANWDSSTPKQTKRKHHLVDRISCVESQVKVARIDSAHKGAGYEWKGESVMEPRDTTWHEYKYNTPLHSDHQCGEEEAEELLSDPERLKLLLPETSSGPGERVGSEPRTPERSKNPLSYLCSSQIIHEPMHASENKTPDYITHDSQSHFDLSHQQRFIPRQCSDTGTVFLKNLIQRGSCFGIGLGSGELTSTHKPSKHKTLPQINKENDEYSLTCCSQPPYERLSCVSTAVQPLDKRTGPKTTSSERYESAHIWAKADKMRSVPERDNAKPKDSVRHHHLLKQQPQGQKLHGDSLDVLFTQDSEGFRVIAHRGPSAPRTPLKNHTNLGLTREKGTLAQEPWVYDEDDEEGDMLFTEDSQGDMVIKH
ncbi:hypothetical protein NHX12_023778 [Muraenolepis orangiensis]|uniref:Uncharacterized protein n=1 Tax=Muraenolepis orangiensis TaxID=630683 RepID=A0A9Q0ELE1_9TELE|nr:hypothetical protein NHX12_023778 [Muraenolepis orangiensis]